MLILLLIVTISQAQTSTDKIIKEFSFEKVIPGNALMIANVNGSVTVVGYAGDKIVVEVERTISAKKAERLEQAKKEIQLGVINLVDTLILYVDGTCNRFEKRPDNKNKAIEDWSYHWRNCDEHGCQEDFNYKMNFILKIPAELNLNVSTINDGDIVIDNINGQVNANNINGNITLNGLTQQAIARTINGDVDVTYVRNPINDCQFYTLNGDINATVQKGLVANLSFESFNGSFYTNIDKVEMLPALLEKSQKGEGVKYKISGNRYQIGKGGAHLGFETFNGNVYLKEKNN
jgi:hypothetical protein